MFRQLLVNLLRDLEQPLSEFSFDQFLSILFDGEGGAGVGSHFFAGSLRLRTSSTSHWCAAGSNATHLVLQELVVGGDVA